METIKATSETIMCTLSDAELKDATSAWQRLFQEWLVARELVPGGLRLTVIPDAAPALRQLIDMEIECCKWISFEVDGPSATMTAATDAGVESIRALWAGPEGVAETLPASVKRPG